MVKHIKIEEENGKVNAIDGKDSEMEDLMKKLDESEKKSEEYLDLLKRSRAEFENLKKRTERDKDIFYNKGKCHILKMLLELKDNFDKVLNHMEMNGENNSQLKTGMTLIFKQLNDILEKEGISRMETEGNSFNPEVHEAVLTEKGNSEDDGIISEEVQAGYMINGKLLRPAKVKVIMAS